ncbi:MAG: exodeoxyribonuclease V subunit gamma [Deltaproteobacteria bacterium]|nr:exodeoxyribonuclease V subunit gamma [Deltaproteobacteria bacterium]
MGFAVHRGNRLETLVELVAALPPASDDPFVPETFVIPTRGLERWLGMRLADARGVFAHARFVSLEDLLDEVLAAAAPDEGKALDAWRPGHLVWHVAEVLRDVGSDPELAPLVSWLGPPSGAGLAGSASRDAASLSARTLQLAKRLAEAFYRYTLHRADVVEQWLDPAALAAVPRADRWQAALWRKVVRHVGDTVPWPGRRLQALTAALLAGAPLPASVPARIVLFGHHTIAPLHLDALVALARSREVLLFRPACSIGPASDPNVRAHALRASLDRLGADLDKLLAERGIESLSHVVSPAPGTALHHLQAAILGGRTAQPVMTPRPLDRSLRMHVCHGALRQVEALRDDLLRLFDEDPTLEPRDVCVMTPDIETFAPLIDAVFRDGDREAAADDPQNPGFPPLHRIHDVSLKRANASAEAFLAILDLVDSRLPQSALVDLLAMTPVLDRIEVDPDHLDEMRGLLRSAGIRWGLDAAWRAAFDQPATDANTWRFGFDRLLLGHALATDGIVGFRDVVPVDDVEGDKTEVLGRIVDWLEDLFAALLDLKRPRSVAAWRDTLGALVTRLLVKDDRSAGQAQPIFDELQALAERASVGRFGGELELGAVRALLVEPFEARRPSISFLSGGLTFCAMLPMRTVPFRVVGLLGMDDGTFPRQAAGLGFDLLQREPRLGDRDTRADDRTTFIETLLAARDHLIVTWTGLRATDRRAMEPAGPVAELRETLVELFGEAARREPITIEHALQPFSARNFEREPEVAPGVPGRPRSFDRRQAEGARIARGPRSSPPPHWTTMTLAPPDPDEPVALDQLIACLSDPAGWFCRQRLQFWLGQREDIASDREPIVLDKLEEWALRDDVLAWELAGVDVAARERALVAAGRLPIGAPGRRTQRRVEAQVARLVQTARPLLVGAARRVPVEVELARRRLMGFVDRLHPDGPGLHRVVTQASRGKARHKLELWIRHLAATTAGAGPIRSTLVAFDGATRLGPVSPAEARRALGELVALHDRAWSAPLAFFPSTSWAWLDALRGGHNDPARAARDPWESRRLDTMTIKGEADDPHVALLFGARDGDFPFEDDDFRELSGRVLGPLLDRIGAGFSGARRSP